MKKVLITSAAAFAVILSAGVSMAGPLNGHGQRTHAHDVRSAVSQTRTHADTKSKYHQTIKKPARGYGSTSENSIDEDCVDAFAGDDASDDDGVVVGNDEDGDIDQNDVK